MQQMVKNRRPFKGKWFLVFALFVGGQSFLLQLADSIISSYIIGGDNLGYVFIAFQGWALYFLLGSRTEAIVKGICGYGAGIAFSVIMIAVSRQFQPIGRFAVPLTALLVVPVMMYFEFAPRWINNVAIFFVGSGAFYGIYTYGGGMTISRAAGIVLLYCGLGLCSGWTTIWFRRRYEQWLKGGSNEQLTETDQSK